MSTSDRTALASQSDNLNVALLQESRNYAVVVHNPKYEKHL